MICGIFILDKKLYKEESPRTFLTKYTFVLSSVQDSLGIASYRKTTKKVSFDSHFLFEKQTTMYNLGLYFVGQRMQKSMGRALLKR